MELERLKRQFEEKVSLYKELKEEALFILDNTLKGKGIKVHSIDSRVKTAESFIEKAKRKQSKKPFEEIGDIVGLRVVCLFLSDIPRIGEVIRSCFEVVSEDNKIEDYDVSSFGYLSVHFIAKMKREYAGPRYDKIKGFLFEIQVRTIAMHSWATISHYLDYKSERDVPKELRRDFYGLSGLFYVADTHFEMFFKARQESQDKMAELFEDAERKVDQEINLDSLTAYLEKRFPDREHSDSKSISKLVQELSKAEYTHISEIERVVDIAWDAFLVYERENPPDDAPKYADIGVARILFSLHGDDFRHLGSFMTDEKCKKYRKLLKK